MEEQNNVVNTTATVEKEGSKFGWGVLGFFIPLVGLILFLVWMKTKPKSSKASGLGALIGFVVGLFLTIISIVIFFTVLGGEIGKLFGNYYYEDYKPITITDIDDDEDVEENDLCIGKFEEGSSKYEYILDMNNDYKECEVVTYKLTENFTIKAERKATDTHTIIYINDNDSLNKKGLMIYQNKLKVGITGKTLITKVMHQTTTNGGYSVAAINTEGEEYNFESNPEGRGRDINAFKIDGMLDDDFKVDNNGSLIISGTRAGDICDNIMDDCLTKENICSNSFESLMSKYNIPSDYAFKSDYTFKINNNGLFDFNNSDVKNTQLWSEYYSKLCE